MFWQMFSALILLTMFAAMAWLIVHARTESIYKPVALLAFFLGVPATALAFSVTLGTAMPTGYWLYDLPYGSFKLLGHKSVPKVGIFVLLDIGDENVPGYYWLPWDVDTSMKIESAQNAGLRITRSEAKLPLFGIFDLSWGMKIPMVTDDTPPQTQLPPKDQPVQNGAVLPPAE